MMTSASGELRPLDLVFGPSSRFVDKYGAEPGRVLESLLASEQDRIEQLSDIRWLHVKLGNACRKIYMMELAGTRAITSEAEFISTQDRSYPTLIWEEEIDLLYHLEAMVLFGRSALDICAYFFSVLLLRPFGKTRHDSFNDLAKKLRETVDVELEEVRAMFARLELDGKGWYRMLCSFDDRRSVRDKIAHQTTIGVEYLEVSPDSEKEFCHIIVEGEAVLLDEFIEALCSGVIRAFMSLELAVSKVWSQGSQG